MGQGFNQSDTSAESPLGQLPSNRLSEDLRRNAEDHEAAVAAEEKWSHLEWAPEKVCARS